MYLTNKEFAFSNHQSKLESFMVEKIICELKSSAPREENMSMYSMDMLVFYETFLEYTYSHFYVS